MEVKKYVFYRILLSLSSCKTILASKLIENIMSKSWAIRNIYQLTDVLRGVVLQDQKFFIHLL